jgi:hypothetical protein
MCFGLFHVVIARRGNSSIGAAVSMRRAIPYYGTGLPRRKNGVLT